MQEIPRPTYEIKIGLLQGNLRHRQGEEFYFEKEP